MNKTTMIILGFIGIILFYHLVTFTGNKIREGFDEENTDENIDENGDDAATIGMEGVGNPENIVRETPEEEIIEEDTTFDSSPEDPIPKILCEPPYVPPPGQACPPQTKYEPKQYCYNNPRYPPPTDPNAGLITTCTNLVKSHVNKCAAGAAGLMTRAFGPSTIDTGDNHQHATDSSLLKFLKNIEGKLKGMVEHKKITDQAIQLAPKFVPKFAYPKRRGLSHDEYAMWRNVLTKGEVPRGLPHEHTANISPQYPRAPLENGTGSTYGGTNGKTNGKTNGSGATQPPKVQIIREKPTTKIIEKTNIKYIKPRDIKVYVTDNRINQVRQQEADNSAQNQSSIINYDGTENPQAADYANGNYGNAEQNSSDYADTGALSGYSIGDSNDYTAYNRDDYM